MSSNTLKHRMNDVCFSKETDSNPKMCGCTNLTFVFEDPFTRDRETPTENRQCSFTLTIVSENAYTFGRTTLKGTSASAYVQASEQYNDLREFHFKLQCDLDAVMDMRSVFTSVKTDTSFTAAVNHAEKKTIRLWNSRTCQYVKIRVVLPEGVSFKDLQQSLSDWFNVSGNCFGYLKIGEPKDC